MVTLSFASVVDFSSDLVMEEVIYTLSNSILESTDVEKVVFMQNNHIITIKNKKT